LVRAQRPLTDRSPRGGGGGGGGRPQRRVAIDRGRAAAPTASPAPRSPGAVRPRAAGARPPAGREQGILIPHGRSSTEGFAVGYKTDGQGEKHRNLEACQSRRTPAPATGVAGHGVVRRSATQAPPRTAKPIPADAVSATEQQFRVGGLDRLEFLLRSGAALRGIGVAEQRHAPKRGFDFLLGGVLRHTKDLPRRDGGGGGGGGGRGRGGPPAAAASSTACGSGGG